tara:strand:+ start:10733 stop:11197 length:465 start_codon:yes stop_codon:yes gene_type:complete
MLVDFDTISDSSRIWIYASELKLNQATKDYILETLFSHLSAWEAHKQPLEAAASILEDHFVVVAVDELNTKASGCSIDTLQKIIQELETNLSISLMNRLNVYCQIDNTIKCIPSFQLKNNVYENTLFYDLTITKKSDLQNFLKPIKDGWCNTLI